MRAYYVSLKVTSIISSIRVILNLLSGFFIESHLTLIIARYPLGLAQWIYSAFVEFYQCYRLFSYILTPQFFYDIKTEKEGIIWLQ